jgi:hypothetical protein
VKQAAKRLRVCTATVYALCKTGKLEHASTCGLGTRFGSLLSRFSGLAGEQGGWPEIAAKDPRSADWHRDQRVLRGPRPGLGGSCYPWPAWLPSESTPY